MRKSQLKWIVKEEVEKHLKTSEYQIFVDLDGVLVDFDGSVTRHINNIFRYVARHREELSKLEPDKKNPKYVLYKLARLAAKELGGWDKRITPHDYGTKTHTKNLMFRLISPNRDLWENMGWAPGGRKLWNFIKPYKPYILSSPTGDASRVGKLNWCAKHLGLGPDRVILRVNKNIDTGDKIGILIDDRAEKLMQFPDEGILYETGDPDSAIEKLKRLGFE